MSDLQRLALDEFFSFYRRDISSELLDEQNVVMSFPIHFSGFHRIEITVTQVSPDNFILSDGAKTIEELRNSGYAINSKLRKRIELISRSARIRVVNDHLVVDADAKALGSSIQRFLEAAKTIGDAYLVQRVYPERDTNLVDQVSALLLSEGVVYRPRYQLRGRIENHTVDFFFPPNGVPGLALNVMGNPTRMAAEAWAFKSTDIKSENGRTRTGIIYESEGVAENSKTILRQSADIAIPSSELEKLRTDLLSNGILKQA